MCRLPAPRRPARRGTERADRLYARVLNEYGDDSVAQLGGAHIACEGVSNILTKVLEWGRLMAYLEQSTRYVPYTDKPHGRWKYHVPAESAARRSPRSSRARWISRSRPTRAGFRRWKHTSARSIRRPPKTPTRVYRSVIRAKALDTLRGLLPAATTSNVGLFGTGQAFEALLLRMFAHPLDEVRAHAHADAGRAAQVIPAFLARVDQPDRGGRWIRVPRGDTRAVVDGAASAGRPHAAEARDEVTLTEFDPDGELKVVASALYARLDSARRSAAGHRAADVGRRARRRSSRVRRRPREPPAQTGRAFERTRYRFDVLADYGAFRDLQRHRLLTLEWQPLVAATRLRRTGGDRGGRRARRLAAR